MADDPRPVADARAAMTREAEDEYRRLLYVAMTRAADRLIVSGCQPGNRNNLRPLCWYDLIEKGLKNSGLQLQSTETSDGVVKRFTRAEDDVPAMGPAAPRRAAPIDMPPWLYEKAPKELADIFLRASAPAEDESRHFRSGRSSQTRAEALRRGTLVHRLLQSLPDVASERRADAAAKFLARNAAEWTNAAREKLAGRVLSLLDDARFAAVFGKDSRAEVSIVGRLERPGRLPVLVSGQIDRLAVGAHEVLIADFKTNQAPPNAASEVPSAYLRQLALYRAMLQKLYPQRVIRAALLWTETAELMEIPTPALDAELASMVRGDFGA
jgi:ATP-dependent helicase/nuclease subunit A